MCIVSARDLSALTCADLSSIPELTCVSYLGAAFVAKLWELCPPRLEMRDFYAIQQKQK